MVLFGQSCCIWAGVVVIGHKWFYSGKSGSTRTKWLYLGKSC